ncbi:MAG: hypothetical protein ABL855_00160 [Sideroxydans sp.]
MQAKDIAELLNEPACTHNKKEKSGCARPKPGATAGGCSFDGAQIALLPIADVARIVQEKWGRVRNGRATHEHEMHRRRLSYLR